MFAAETVKQVEPFADTDWFSTYDPPATLRVAQLEMVDAERLAERKTSMNIDIRRGWSPIAKRMAFQTRQRILT